MVKTPRTRHSKAQREPVTIELEPGEVSRVADEDADDVDGRRRRRRADAGAGEPPAALRKRQPTAESSRDAGSAQPTDERRPHDEIPLRPGAAEPAFAETEASRAGYDFAGNDAAEAEPAPRMRRDARRCPRRPPSASRSARGSGIAAGLIGGVVALAAGGLLQFAGLLGAPGLARRRTPALGGVEAEIAALKTEIAAPQGHSAAAARRVSGQGRRPLAGAGSGQDRCRLAAAGGRVRRRRRKCRASGARRQDQGDRDGDRRPRPGPAAHRRPKSRPINEKIAGVEALAKAAGEAGSADDGRLGALEQSLSRAVRQGRRAGRAAEDRARHRRVGAEVGDRARRAVPGGNRDLCRRRSRCARTRRAARLCRKGRRRPAPTSWPRPTPRPMR